MLYLPKHRLLSRRAAIVGLAALATPSKAAKQLCAAVPDAGSGGGGGGGGAPITNACTLTYPCSVTGAVATVLGASCGVADPSRMVVVTAVGFRGISASDVVSATFNGLSVRVAGVLGPPYGPNQGYCAIAWGMVPLGTTVDVTMTFKSAVGSMWFTVCDQRGVGSNPFVRDVAALNGATPLTAGPVMPSGGYGFAAFVGSVGSNGPTVWTGTTANFDQSVTSTQTYQLSTAVGGASPITATNPNTQHSLAMVTVGSAATVTPPSIVQFAMSVQASGAPTVTLPNVPTPGNLMVALCNIYVNEPASAGWINFGFNGSAQDQPVLYIRVVQAGDGKTQSPTGGYGSQPSSLVIYEVANYDDGWGSPVNAQGPGASGIASFDGHTNDSTNVASYTDTVSSTFDNVLILGIAGSQTNGVAPAIAGATPDQSLAGSARSATAFHRAVNAGSYPITASFSPPDEFVWNSCVIAPRYR
jgi:hypothetical protein